MHIKQFISQSRRDFWAIFECEHCGFIEERSGYDDQYFHQMVIPDMKCKRCGEKASDNYRAFAPKYDEGEII